MRSAMSRPLVPALFACMAMASAGAYAEFPTIEAAAAVTDANTVRLERDSITRYGDMLRFDVWVGWKDPSARPQGEPSRKVIRYLARCNDGTLAISSVASFRTTSEPSKTYGIAPGGWDFEKPAPGSQAADWLARVCDSAY